MNVETSNPSEGNSIYALKWNYYQTSRGSGFVDLLEDPEYSMTDVTLSCEGEFIQAHKIVLAVSSPFFKRFFKMNRVERSGLTLIALANVKFRDLKNVVHFIYHGEVHLSNADLQNFLDTAKLLQIEGLDGNQPKCSSEQTTQRPQVRTSVPASLSSHQKTSASSESKSAKRRRAVVPSSHNHHDSQNIEVGPSASTSENFPSIATTPEMDSPAFHDENEDEEEMICIDMKPEAIALYPVENTVLFYDEDIGEDLDSMDDDGHRNLSFSQTIQGNFSSDEPGPSTAQAGSHASVYGTTLGRCNFCPKVPGRQKRSSRTRCESCKHFVCAKETCRRSKTVQRKDGNNANQDAVSHGYNGEMYDESSKLHRIVCLCGTTFSHKATLSRHVKEMQTKCRVTCQGCGKSFDRTRNLLRHMQKSCTATLSGVSNS